jgi:ribose-phosphate pyrophosphokinase
MELAGADRFVTMDLHAQQIQGFFKRPMDHLYAQPLLTEVIKRVGIENTVVVSPDAGYAKQARKFAAALNLPVAIGDKNRTDHSENAEVLEIIGDVKGKNCLIVDDFTISGGTLVDLAKGLKARGALDINCMLSHNIISAKGVEKLNASPIKAVYSTDTVYNPNIEGQEKFKTISVAPMFAETIMRYYKHDSINQMFDKLPEYVTEACIKMAGLEL